MCLRYSTILSTCHSFYTSSSSSRLSTAVSNQQSYHPSVPSLAMASSSNRSVYARQENIHPHPNGFPSAIQGSHKNAATARMTNPNTALVASNGIYSDEPGMHPSSLNIDYGMNTIQDSEVVANPRKRPGDEPLEIPRRRAVVAVGLRECSCVIIHAYLTWCCLVRTL